jgi:hypothetical protein
MENMKVQTDIHNSRGTCRQIPDRLGKLDGIEVKGRLDMEPPKLTEPMVDAGYEKVGMPEPLWNRMSLL